MSDNQPMTEARAAVEKLYLTCEAMDLIQSYVSHFEDYMTEATYTRIKCEGRDTVEAADVDAVALQVQLGSPFEQREAGEAEPDECPECHGAGFFHSVNGPATRCSVCHGTGEVATSAQHEDLQKAYVDIANLRAEVERMKEQLEESETKRRDLLAENLQQFDGHLTVPVLLPSEKYQEFKGLFNDPPSQVIERGRLRTELATKDQEIERLRELLKRWNLAYEHDNPHWMAKASVETDKIPHIPPDSPPSEKDEGINRLKGFEEAYKLVEAELADVPIICEDLTGQPMVDKIKSLKKHIENLRDTLQGVLDFAGEPLIKFQERYRMYQRKGYTLLEENTVPDPPSEGRTNPAERGQGTANLPE